MLSGVYQCSFYGRQAYEKQRRERERGRRIREKRKEDEDGGWVRVGMV